MKADTAYAVIERQGAPMVSMMLSMVIIPAFAGAILALLENTDFWAFATGRLLP